MNRMLALVLALVPWLGGASADAQKSSERPPVRLDTPVTPENSYLQDFGHGVVLRLPKILYPSLDFPSLNQPVKAAAIAMTFLYPDMTQSGWQSATGILLEKERGTYVPQKDRFPVNIIWMFYTPPDSDNFVPGSKQPSFRFEPRPPRIELNRHCLRIKEGQCDSPMRRIPSGIDGIDAQVSEKWAKAHPEARRRSPADGGTYVAKPDSPYELLMDCGALECRAHVYSKKHHFQYRMLFPSEAVSHTDALIGSIDKMIGGWILKK
jgi:hypothetical protein